LPQPGQTTAPRSSTNTAIVPSSIIKLQQNPRIALNKRNYLSEPQHSHYYILSRNYYSRQHSRHETEMANSKLNPPTDQSLTTSPKSLKSNIETPQKIVRESTISFWPLQDSSAKFVTHSSDRSVECPIYSRKMRARKICFRSKEFHDQF
jgi:hypothetical protein